MKVSKTRQRNRERFIKGFRAFQDLVSAARDVAAPVTSYHDRRVNETRLMNAAFRFNAMVDGEEELAEKILEKSDGKVTKLAVK